MLVLLLLVLVACLIALAPLQLELEALNLRARAKVRWLGFGLGLDSRGSNYQLQLGNWIFHRGTLKSESKTPAKTDKPKRKGSGFSWQRLLGARGQLNPELGYLKRHVHVENLELDLRIATPDPALTGELLGLALGLRSVLSRLVDLSRLRVEADFRTDWPQVYFDLRLKTRLVHLLVVGFRVWLVLRQLISQKTEVQGLVKIPAKAA